MAHVLEIVIAQLKIKLNKECSAHFVSKFFFSIHTRTIDYNMAKRFLSLPATKCPATLRLRKAYPVINSNIPRCVVKKLCVIAKVTNDDTFTNDVCVVGKIGQVINYFLDLLSVGITFRSLVVHPANSFYTREDKQYLNEGYGKVTYIGNMNVVVGEYM